MGRKLKISLMILSIVSTFMPTFLLAQDYYYPDIFLYCSGGLARSLEPGDFGRLWGNGLNMNIGVGYQPSKGIIAGVFIRYHSFPPRLDQIREKAAREGADSITNPETVKMPSAELFLRVNLFIRERSGIYPYLIFNMGNAKPSENSIYAFDSAGTWLLARAIEEDLLSCFSAGIGIEIKVSDNIHFFGEIRYAQVLQVRTNGAYLPINLGVAIPFKVF